MKYFELTNEEKSIEKIYDKGKFTPVADKEKLKEAYREIAENALNKTRNINIRLSEKTLAKLKEKAANQGLPYQTMAASILHQYTNESAED